MSSSPTYDPRDMYKYAQSQMLPSLELETVIFGMCTMAIILGVYGTLRLGIGPPTVRTRTLPAMTLVVLYALFTAHWVLSIIRTRDLLFGGWYIHEPNDFGMAQFRLRYIYGSFLSEGSLFGMFCALIAFAIYVFAQKDLHARLQQVMLACTVLMYSLSLSHWVLQTRFVSVKYRDNSGPYAIPLTDLGLELAPLVLVSVNVILGDAIVLWRMTVFCNMHVYARTLAAILLTSTIALSIANIVEEVRGAAWGANPTGFLQFYEASFSDSVCGTAVLAMSLAANVISTSVIAWRAWLYRRDIAAHLGTFTRYSIAEKVMSVLIESGCIYCIIWTLYILESKLLWFDSSVEGTPVSALTGGAAWFSRLMPQLTGIYPTIILVLVALEQSYMENVFSESKLSAFVAARPDSEVQTVDVSTPAARTAIEEARFIDIDSRKTRRGPPHTHEGFYA